VGFVLVAGWGKCGFWQGKQSGTRLLLTPINCANLHNHRVFAAPLVYTIKGVWKKQGRKLMHCERPQS